jgi:hypothetical protein
MKSSKGGALWIRFVVLAAAFLFVSCDSFVSARVKVLKVDGSPATEAIVGFDEDPMTDGVHADQNGCAHFGRVVQGFQRVYSVKAIERDYKPAFFETGLLDYDCVVVVLAHEQSSEDSTVEFLKSEVDCPCSNRSGHEHAVMARFKVQTADRENLAGVEIRKAGEGPRPWADVADEGGCLGISWIVPINLESVPLELQKPGYETIVVDVPTMDERCYSVVMSRRTGSDPTEVIEMPLDACECDMFSGTLVWK